MNTSTSYSCVDIAAFSAYVILTSAAPCTHRVEHSLVLENTCQKHHVEVLQTVRGTGISASGKLLMELLQVDIENIK